ncbi:hypothetical protein L5I01_30915 [Gordonia sp. HY442]|uniref:hypothetical protein n=1 Tax=Gordonia zhenghanii TaxID=2911516 RepID=UPI001F2CD9AD|nr:hypothetical protein [Gordonia zhenghanii]MCF8607775.1 hypothetical protein [Gordonia zhenghanii]
MNPQMPQQNPIPNHATQPVGESDYAPPADDYTGFSIGAVATIVGAVLVLISYPMVWFVAKLDDGATISGLGTTTSTPNFEVTVQTGRLHWVAGIAMIVLIGLGVARLLGKFGENLKRVPVVLGVIGLLSAGISTLSVSDDFSIGAGLYLALVGSIIALVGAIVMGLLKK